MMDCGKRQTPTVTRQSRGITRLIHVSFRTTCDLGCLTMPAAVVAIDPLRKFGSEFSMTEVDPIGDSGEKSYSV